MDDIMNLPELADYLKMSQASLYHLVAAGKVPGMKVGKQWRFCRETIDEWLGGLQRRQADVLVVEDDQLILNMIVRVLQEAGHNVVGTESVEKALGLLQEIEFDLVVLDLILGDGTGLDVVNAAVGLASAPEIILVTGYPGHELIDAIRVLLPYVTVLNKPVRLEALLELAGRAASLRQR